MTSKKQRYYRKRIHRTVRGELVISKSEVIIANELHRRGIDYAYEKELRFDTGPRCKPDFTIEDLALDQTVYWEHCGLLHIPEYSKRWLEKQNWYRKNGILLLDEGGGKNGTLVATSDDPRSGFDTLLIASILDQLFGEA